MVVIVSSSPGFHFVFATGLVSLLFAVVAFASGVLAAAVVELVVVAPAVALLVVGGLAFVPVAVCSAVWGAGFAVVSAAIAAIANEFNPMRALSEITIDELRLDFWLNILIYLFAKSLASNAQCA